MGEDVLRQMIQWIEGVAPVTWEAAVRQIYMDALGLAVMALPLWTIILLCIRYLWRFYRTNEGDDDLVIGAAIGSLICAIAAVGLTFSTVARFMNPNWYAIERLMNLLP